VPHTPLSVLRSSVLLLLGSSETELTADRQRVRIPTIVRKAAWYDKSLPTFLEPVW
jgi:hypothetical protein